MKKCLWLVLGWLLMPCLPVRGMDVAVGMVSEQGKTRPRNEDTEMNYLSPDGKTRVFGVFDGHGGEACAKFIVKNNKMGRAIVDDESFAKEKEQALKHAFKVVDEEFAKQRISSGATATVAVLEGKNLWLANAGDSRIVVAKKDGSFIATHDHKASDPAEQERIKSVGGNLCYVSRKRVYSKDGGSIAVSRSIGDRDFKPCVICEPDVSLIDASTVDFIVMACDGHYNVMTNEETIKSVKDELHGMGVSSKTINDAQAEKITRTLVQKDLDHPKQKDNVSMMIVFLKEKEDKKLAEEMSEVTSGYEITPEAETLKTVVEGPVKSENKLPEFDSTLSE